MRRAAFFAIIGLGGAAILIWLGTWQIQRLGWKQGVIADIETRIAAAPVALPAQPDPEADAYLPVTVTGELQAVFLRVLVSQKSEGAGFRIIAPLVTTQGARVMVDLGFLPATNDAFALQPGTFTVTGNLQWPQETDMFTPAPEAESNLWFTRDVPAMADVLLTQSTMVVASEVTPPLTRVTPLPVDTALIPNNHLQYAITWFSLAAIWIAMSLYFVLRPARPSKG